MTAERCNYQYIIVEVDEADSRHEPRRSGARSPRRECAGPALFLPWLPSDGALSVVFPPCRAAVARTERLTQRVMSLPTGTAVGPEEIETVCAIIRLAVTA